MTMFKPRFFKPFLLKAHDALFAYMLRTGLVLAVVQDEGQSPAIEEDDDEARPTDDASVEGEGAPNDESNAETEAETEGDEAGEGEADEVVISLGDEPAPSDDDEKRAPDWVRDLRKSHGALVRRQRELEAENARLKGATGQPVAVGEKPTLSGCDFDAEKFEQELEAWHSRKRDADELQRKQQQTEEQQRTQWQARIDAVDKAAATLKVRDYADAAQAFEDTFSLVQQGIVAGGPEDAKTSALLRYALGKNPKKAKELAAISDPVKFTFAVAKLEAQLKVTPRKQAPAPDRVVRSSVAGAAAVDNQLERLRAEAAKTGDLSKVIAYKSQIKAKQRA